MLKRSNQPSVGVCSAVAAMMDNFAEAGQELTWSNSGPSVPYASALLGCAVQADCKCDQRLAVWDTEGWRHVCVTDRTPDPAGHRQVHLHFQVCSRKTPCLGHFMQTARTFSHLTGYGSSAKQCQANLLSLQGVSVLEKVARHCLAKLAHPAKGLNAYNVCVK